jgi:hypothetical protein
MVSSYLTMTSEPIKLGMNTIPLEITPVVTLAPLNVGFKIMCVIHATSVTVMIL